MATTLSKESGILEILIKAKIIETILKEGLVPSLNDIQEKDVQEIYERVNKELVDERNAKGH